MIEPFFVEVMRVLRCHQDIQIGDGRGELLRYVSGYVNKFSSAFNHGWLNDKASDYSVARRVLFDYHPLEPEMWLSLAGRYVPQCSYGGTLYPVVAPWVAMEKKPGFVERYEACDWRGDKMALLEYLRKSNDQGEIARWVREKHKAHVVLAAYESQKDGGEQNYRKFYETLLRDYKKHVGGGSGDEADHSEEPMTFSAWVSHMRRRDARSPRGGCRCLGRPIAAEIFVHVSQQHDIQDAHDKSPQ